GFAAAASMAIVIGILNMPVFRLHRCLEGVDIFTTAVVATNFPVGGGTLIGVTLPIALDSIGNLLCLLLIAAGNPDFTCQHLGGQISHIFIVKNGLFASGNPQSTVASLFYSAQA